MNFTEEAKSQIKKYARKYNENPSPILIKQLQEKQDLKSRKNYEGHITASCYVLSQDKKNLLLIFNKNWNAFLQPGGHCEKEDSTTMKTALRELKEETEINEKDCGFLDETPINIDTHKVPQNPKKNEKEHKHHDFGYLLRLKKEIPIKLNIEEVSSFKWVSIHDSPFSKKLHL